MIFTKIQLKGVHIIDLEKNEDERGFFARFWCHDELKKMGLDTDISQINTSMSKQRGSLRGLHFQRPPNSETKIVRCLRGAIWDVIVDLRYGSKTFGQWYGIELNEDNRTMLYVPKGFAHGFISLKNNSEVIYLVSEFYSPNEEGCLYWNDPDLAVDWPIEPTVVSKKDDGAPYLRDIEPIIIKVP